MHSAEASAFFAGTELYEVGQPAEGSVFRDSKSRCHALIAAINGWTPNIVISRLKLYASTCKLISVPRRLRFEP
jgi:hypothetical protein